MLGRIRDWFRPAPDRSDAPHMPADHYDLFDHHRDTVDDLARRAEAE